MTPADRRYAWPAAAVAIVLALTLAAGAATAVYGPARARALVVRPVPGSTPTPTPTVPHPTPTERGPALRPLAANGDAPAPGAVRDRLGKTLDDPSLGRRFGAYVADAATGKMLLARGPGQPATPASTAKLATTVAALEAVGPDARITTRVVRTGRGVVLVGGGDPSLLGPGRQPDLPAYPEFARLATLARRTAHALGKAAHGVRVRFDDSLYTGPRTAPGWKPNYVPEGDVAPVTALEIDHGREDPADSDRAVHPARAAAEAFAGLLERHGVEVSGRVGRVKAPKHAAELARVRSPTISELVEFTLTYSDNDMAEALARQVALAEGQPASFAGAAVAVRAVLSRLGLAEGISLADGSGLSTADRVTPRALGRLLRAVASGEHPELGAVLSGLPVGGFTGTLASRFEERSGEAGAGVVRAKTGTLSGVSSLAGYVQDRSGRLLVFAFVANAVPPDLSWQTRGTLDHLAARLAGCGCAGQSSPRSTPHSP